MACGPGGVVGPQVRLDAENGIFPWVTIPAGARDFGVNGVTWFQFDRALDASTIEPSVTYLRLSDDGTRGEPLAVTSSVTATGNYVVIRPLSPLQPNRLHAVIMS